MGMARGEKMSRLGVGLFALLLIGGLGAFFAGLLDPLLGTAQPPAKQPPAPMPFPKQTAQHVPNKSAAPLGTAVVTPSKPAAVQPDKPVAPSPSVATVIGASSDSAASIAGEPVKLPTPEQAQPAMPSQAITAGHPAGTSNIGVAVPGKPASPVKPARSHDMDLRSCLDLTDNLAIAQCAYKTP